MHLIGDPRTALAAMGKGYEEFAGIAQQPKVQKKQKGLGSMFIQDVIFALPDQKRSKRSKSKAYTDPFNVAKWL